MPRDVILITCEHGGNRVPASFDAPFAVRRSLLDTHRGFDRGALTLARRMARAHGAPLIHSTVSRLLVDLNRSERHPDLHHPAIRRLDAATRRGILDRYYHPHRRRVEDTVRRLAGHGNRVVHIGVHTFTPRLRGEIRRADVALLYDPERRGEAEWCARWRDAFVDLAPDWCVRRNYPYRGSDDGLTTTLRTRFGPREYLGIELEVNQALVRSPRSVRRVGDAVVGSLRAMRAEGGPAP